MFINLLLDFGQGNQNFEGMDPNSLNLNNPNPFMGDFSGNNTNNMNMNQMNMFYPNMYPNNIGNNLNN